MTHFAAWRAQSLRRAALVLLCLGAALGASAALRPNIIFILADDLGYGELGCYGQRLIRTPHLDRMAEEGLRFTQFYAGATVCAPSRSVLMTGQHGGHTRVRGNAGRENRAPQNLSQDDVTVADVLRKAGYKTALVGKWGLGDEGSPAMPTRKGFDFFYGYLDQTHAHNHYPEFLIRNEYREPLRNRLVRQGKPYEETGAGWADPKVDYAPDMMTDEALQWIEARAHEPFFLYFSPILPHANNEATRGLGNGQEVPWVGGYTNRPWKTPDQMHAAAVTRLDAYVGSMLQLLRRLRVESNTVVFFASDNGHHQEGGNDPDLFDANGPLRGMKRDLFEGGIRVPMLAWWPGTIAAGRTTYHVGYFGDFMATAAELAGASLPGGRDSLSFLPTLLGRHERQKQHEYLYWEFHERGFHQAIRWGDWKGIRHGLDAPLALYHLGRDQGEVEDVAGRYPHVVSKLQQLLLTARTVSPLWPVKAQSTP